MSYKAKKLEAFAEIFQSEKLDGTILKIPIHKIVPSEFQPRKNRKVSIEDLAKSIEKEGLLSPIVVYKDGDVYRIIAGERRYHAIASLGWKEIECKVLSREQKDYFRISLIENLQREDLTPEEEIEALYYLKTRENLTDQELGELIGKSRNYVSEMLSIRQLPEEIMEKCKSLGVFNKNFLIQVVQSYKKGNVEELLKNIESGAIKTVKDAKEFNKKTIVSEHERKLPSKTGNKTKLSLHQIQIKRENQNLVISCEDTKILKKIERWIKTNLPAIIEE